MRRRQALRVVFIREWDDTIVLNAGQKLDFWITNVQEGRIMVTLNVIGLLVLDHLLVHVGIIFCEV